MNSPSTLTFMLRWQFVPLACGVIIALVSGYGLWTYKPLPSSSPFESPLPYVPLFWGALAIGVGLVLWAWSKASKLRNG